MENQKRRPETFEEMAARAVRLGREVALTARGLRPGSGSHDVAFLDRYLAPLRDGKPFDHRYAGGFEAALARLQDLRDAEEIGRHREFVGFEDPEAGAVGVVQEVVEYSDRGRALAALVDRLEAFLAVRQGVLDRLAVEKFLLSGM